MVKSFLCWLLGCKWKEWVHTETKWRWKCIDFDGFGIEHWGYAPEYYGYDKVLSHCSRCGKENPAYNATKAAEPPTIRRY